MSFLPSLEAGQYKPDPIPCPSLLHLDSTWGLQLGCQDPWEGKMQISKLDQVGNRHKRMRETRTGHEFGGVAWKLESQKEALFIQLLYSRGRAFRRGHPLLKPRVKRGWHSPSQLSPVSLSIGSSFALRPQAMSGRCVHLRDLSGYFCGHCQPLGRYIGTHTSCPLSLFLTIGLHAQLL